MRERYQLAYVQLDPDWLERQIREVRKEIESWPAWMRDGLKPQTDQHNGREVINCERGE